MILLASGSAWAQNVITTVAGTDWVFPETPLAALNAPISAILGIAVDQDGNVFLADRDNDVILRLARGGIITVVAGNRLRGYGGDGGPAARAALRLPVGVVLDRQGNLYIADDNNHRIRRVDRQGIITTVAGNGVPAFAGDGGPATAASLNSPRFLALDQAGNLYISDSNNHRVRKVTPAGIISTFAGNGRRGFSGDGGQARDASLDSPAGLAVDAVSLYIVDRSNARLRKVTPDGRIATVKDGLDLDDVVIDATGNPIVTAGGRVQRIDPGGSLTLLAGNGEPGLPVDGEMATKSPMSANSIGLDPAGGFYVGDSTSSRLYRVGPDGIVRTVAGNGRFRFSGDGGTATAAALNLFLSTIALDGKGNLYIADTNNHRIRRVGPDGVITTVAGTGQPGPAPRALPVLALDVPVTAPRGVAADASGNFYFGYQSGPLYKVTPAGVMTRVAAGTGSNYHLALDNAGNLYTNDRGGHRVRIVTPAGAVSVAAGNGRPGFSGDGQLAINASLNFPEGVAVDTAGNLYIADQGNQRIRRVDSRGIITTVAGNGRPGFSGDGGRAVDAALGFPAGLAVDAVGNLYVADRDNARVRRVTPQGRIDTIAGVELFRDDNGDGGPAVNATVTPHAVAVDASGNLYIAEAQERIRKILVQPPSLDVSPSVLQFAGRAGGAPAPVDRFSVTSPVTGVRFAISISGGERWLKVHPTDGSTPLLIEVTADPGELPPGEYGATITLEAPLAAPVQRTVRVTFSVGDSLPPTLALDKDTLSFPFPRTGRPRLQTLAVSNAGSGTLRYTALAETTSGGDWLSVSPVTGDVTPRGPAIVAVEADPAGLAPGTYSGTVKINARVVPVTLTVSGQETAVLLSQSGLSFTAVAGGGVVPPQDFGVLNIGNGGMPWSASSSTLSGGPSWLRATPPDATTDAASDTVPGVTAAVIQAGLEPGRYYGLVRVDAPGAANTPQVVTAFLDVLPPGQDPGSVVQPAELVFTGIAGSQPSSLSVLIYNLSTTPISFRSRYRGLGLTYSPTDGVVVPQQPLRVTVLFKNLPPARSPSLNNVLTFQFSEGTVRRVIIGAVSTPGAEGRTAQPRQADGCSASFLVPAFLTLGQAATVPAGWPAGMSVEVKDDCGEPMRTGSVVVSFSNGDPPVVLQSLKDGRWHGTWQNRNAANPRITVRLEAEEPLRKLKGERELQAHLLATQNPPFIASEGVVSAASPVPHVPLGPGAIIAIYGERLTEGLTESATGAPLPNRLGGAQVIMAGRELPLLFASPGQMNAIVPYELTQNTTHQVLVRRAMTYSRPVPVNVAPAQPAVFLSGGRAIAVAVRGQEEFLVGVDSPARAGDVLVIYCAGLGAVAPAVPAGTLSPSAPPAATLDAVRVRIGGVEAPVFFAGLAPGFVALYQINARVPEGVVAGNDVPVVIEVAGQRSPAVSLAVR